MKRGRNGATLGHGCGWRWKANTGPLVPGLLRYFDLGTLMLFSGGGASKAVRSEAEHDERNGNRRSLLSRTVGTNEIFV
jgi:hypothetical protein